MLRRTTPIPGWQPGGWRRVWGGALNSVIPGRATWRGPGIHWPADRAVKWILRCAIAHHSSCFARPGMTKEKIERDQQNRPTDRFRFTENRVKQKNLRGSKLFLFSRIENGGISIAIPSHSEGVGRRYQRGTGCGGRGGAECE